MAENKIQYTDLIEADALPKLIAELKKVEAIMNDIAISAKKVVIESAKMAEEKPFTGYDNLKNIQANVDKVKEATERLRTAEEKRGQAMTEREKLEKKLLQLRTAEAKQLAGLRQQINEETKALRDEAKAAMEGANAFKALTKATNEAQDEFKKLAAAHGLNSKEAKEAFEKFDKLDKQLRAINETARDGRRDVGRYKIATEGLNKSLSALEKLGIITLLLKIGEMFSQNTQGGAALEKVFGRLTISIAVFVNRAVSLIPLVTSSFTALANGIKIAVKEAQLFIAELPVIGGSAEQVQALTTEIEALKNESKGLAVIGIEDLTKAFDGMGNEIDGLIKKNNALIDSTIKYRKLVIQLTKEEADLAVERERLASIADDDTLALEIMQAANAELLQTEIALSEKRLQIATENARIATERAKVRVGDLAAEEAAAQAYVALQEAQALAEQTRLNVGMQGRKIARDNMELDLDQLIDLADKRKMINETTLADETLSIEKRKQALIDSGKDIEASFRKQAEVIQKTRGVMFNIDDLINEKDTVALNKRIKSLGLNEIEQNRLREIIMERVQANEDLRISAINLEKAEAKQLATEADIRLQEQALLELIDTNGKQGLLALEKLAERREKLAIKELQAKVVMAEVGSQEQLTAQQELNNKLLAQQEKQAQKELEIEQKKQEERKAQIESTAEFLSNLSQKISDQRVADIDKTSEASAKRESELVELATQGSEDATKALAFERKAQAELALQRDKEIEKQARRELALSAAKIFGAKVAGGVPAGQALAQTGAELLALQSIVNALPSFYEGAERVGDELEPTIPGRDGHIIRVDGDERILSPSQSAMIPKGMSNMELALMSRARMSEKDSNGSELLAKKLDSIERAIKQQPVLTARVFDADRQAVISTTKRGTTLERKHKSLGLNG